MNEKLVRQLFVGSAAVAVIAGAGIGTSVALSGGTDSAPDVAERGSTPTDTPDPASTNIAPGASRTFAAGDAGFVTLTRDPDGLRVVTVAPAPGVVFETERAAGREIEVQFVRNGVRIDFNVELEDGAVRVRVRNRATDDDGRGDDDTATTVPTPTAPSPTDPAPGVPAPRVDNSGPGSASSGPGPGPNVPRFDDDDNSGPGNGLDDGDDIDDDSSGSGSGGSGGDDSSGSGSG